MVPVAREVFEDEMIPWVGQEYAAWLRTSARPHPADEHQLEAAYVEQRVAAHAGDKRRLSELHQTIEQLQQRLESARRALDIWQRTDPAELEERIAWELSRAPHADVLVGIPGEADRA